MNIDELRQIFIRRYKTACSARCSELQSLWLEISGEYIQENCNGEIGVTKCDSTCSFCGDDNLKLQILAETYPVNYAKVHKTITRKKN